MRPLCQSETCTRGFNGDGRTDRASLQSLHVGVRPAGYTFVRPDLSLFDHKELSRYAYPLVDLFHLDDPSVKLFASVHQARYD